VFALTNHCYAPHRTAVLHLVLVYLRCRLPKVLKFRNKLRGSIGNVARSDSSIIAASGELESPDPEPVPRPDGSKKLTAEERRQNILVHHTELFRRNRTSSVCVSAEQAAVTIAELAANGESVVVPQDNAGLQFSDDDSDSTNPTFDSGVAKPTKSFDFDSSDGASDTEGSPAAEPRCSYQTNVPSFSSDSENGDGSGDDRDDAGGHMFSCDSYAVNEELDRELHMFDKPKDAKVPRPKEPDPKRSANNLFSTLTQACRETCDPLPELPGTDTVSLVSNAPTSGDWNERYQHLRHEITQFNANTPVCLLLSHSHSLSLSLSLCLSLCENNIALDSYFAANASNRFIATE
jgi:hypothetical protein